MQIDREFKNINHWTAIVIMRLFYSYFDLDLAGLIPWKGIQSSPKDRYHFLSS